MGTLKKGVLTGKQDIEGNDIRIGDTVEDICTGKQYIVNKYGKLFNEGLGSRTLVGHGVRISKSSDGTETEPLSEEDILGVKADDRGLETAYENEPEIEEKHEDDFSMRMELMEDQFFADELRRRGYTVTAEKTITTTIKL